MIQVTVKGQETPADIPTPRFPKLEHLIKFSIVNSGLLSVNLFGTCWEQIIMTAKVIMFARANEELQAL